jgi:hypothetical protein
VRLALLLLALPLYGQITIDAGSPTDQYFIGGTPWVIAPPGTTDATLRYGVAFRYKLPAKGPQVLTLRFREPTVTGIGQRRFSVYANHQPIISGLDLWVEAGRDLLERSYVVVPSGGFVELRFETQIRSAVVSSITLAPLFPVLQIVDFKLLDPYSGPPFREYKNPLARIPAFESPK